MSTIDLSAKERITIEYNQGNKKLTLKKEIKEKDQWVKKDYVNIHMKKKNSAQRSVLMTAFIVRNRYIGNTARRIFGQLATMKY